MSLDRRSPRRSLIVMLAVPVIVAVYGAAIASRMWAAVRPAVAAVLGATVIGSVYADVAIQRAPRATPLRAAAVMSLAVVLLGASVAPAPAVAANPLEAVIAAAERYIGTPYRLGAEGPNRVDCSGLIFRVFSDAGELPRISGRRLRAVGYYRWFASRGLASRTEGKRGDLVVYDDGGHIGIYLGNGKVLSALVSGVAVHALKGGISVKFNAFLNVQWGTGDGTGDGTGGGGGEQQGGDNAGTNGKKGKQGNPGNAGNPGSNAGANPGSAGGADETPANDNASESRLPRGMATGTLNLRKMPGPDEKIIGWVSKSSQFKVLGTGHSPSGALWLNVEMANGKAGWIWAHWTRIEGR